MDGFGLGIIIVLTIYYIATMAMLVFWISKDIIRLATRVDALTSELARRRTSGPPKVEGR